MPLLSKLYYVPIVKPKLSDGKFKFLYVECEEDVKR